MDVLGEVGSKGVTGVVDGFPAHPHEFPAMHLKEQGLMIPAMPGWLSDIALPLLLSLPHPSGPPMSGGLPCYFGAEIWFQAIYNK